MTNKQLTDKLESNNNTRSRKPPMKFLENIEEVTGNTYATRGETENDDRISYDAGSYILNALMSGSIYGGIWSNGITMLNGAESTGKTFMALSAVKSFLDNDETANVVYFETEGAISRQMLLERGIDADRVYFVPVVTVQQFRTQASKILTGYEKEKTKGKLMIVLDSLGMLSTEKEVADIEDGKDTRDMTRAQLLRGTFRVLTLKTSHLKVPFIVTNHTYESVGGMFPQSIPSGGKGALYAASTVLMLSKKKEKEGTDVVGNIIHVKTYKSRFSKENQMVDVRLFYESGLDKYYGLLELAEKHDIIQKMGGRYVMPDGAKVYAKSIYKDPEKYFTDDIMAKLDEAAKMDFTYGQGKEDNSNYEEELEENETE